MAKGRTPSTLNEYLTEMGEDGIIHPHPSFVNRYKDKLTKTEYKDLFFKLVCYKLNLYESYYQNPTVMIKEKIWLEDQLEDLRRAYGRLLEKRKKEHGLRELR